MKKLALFTSAFLAFGSLLHAQIEAPDNLRLQWSPAAQAGNPSITLTWTPSPTEATGGYRIERRLGALAWATAAFATVTGPSGNLGAVGTWTDPLTTTTVLTDSLKNQNLTITYRVRPIVGMGSTVLQRASEVITAGRITSKIFDTDGDGVSDAAEQSWGFNPNDWADATGDTDGDGFPNAWEIAMGQDPLVATNFSTLGFLDGTAPWMIEVDPNVAVNATRKLTIQDALNSLTGGTTINKRYRIIRVKPGKYLENLIIPENYHVAIIPWRSDAKQVTHVGGNSATADSSIVAAALNGKRYDAKEKFELIGTATATAIPVIQTTGTFVLDSFRISRTAGSRDAIISVADDAEVSTNLLAPRLSMCRLVNCLVTNVDTGLTALVEHTRSRLVLSHCTFYMNSTDTASDAHTYTTGTADLLASTARLQIHNSIFWNPINTRTGKLEFQSIGEITGESCCMMVTEGLTGAFGVNPGVTPLGYIAGMASSSFKAGKQHINVPEPDSPVPPALPTSDPKDVHAPRDIHGEFRYRHAVRFNGTLQTLVVGASELPDRLTDRGADQWVDADMDSIPDSEDRMMGLAANAGYDGDSDLLNEVMEYLGGTDLNSADSPYLTINQARSIFAPLASSQDFSSFYTRSQVDQFFLKKSDANVLYLTEEEGNDRYLKRNVLQTIRVLPGGDISMGEFTGQAP